MIDWKGHNIPTNNIREVFGFLIIMVLLVCLLLSGCQKNVNVMPTYQSNYGEQCLYAPNTDSYKNLLFCYQMSLSEEHAQNKLANDITSK